MKSASAAELESDIDKASEMSFVINTQAIERDFVTNPSNTKQYTFVRRLSSATREGEMISIQEGRRLYWLAEVEDSSTGKLKVVAVPLKFKR